MYGSPSARCRFLSWLEESHSAISNTTRAISRHGLYMVTLPGGTGSSGSASPMMSILATPIEVSFSIDLKLTLDSLPCRIRVHAEGFEAFLYNRTPAYEEIVKRMEKHEAEARAGKTENKSSEASSTSNGHGLRNRTSIRRDQTKNTSGESLDGDLFCVFERVSTFVDLQMSNRPILMIPFETKVPMRLKRSWITFASYAQSRSR